MPAHFPRLLQHHSRIPTLVTVLNQNCASSHESLSRRNQVADIGKTSCIEDGIEAWKSHLLVVSQFEFLRVLCGRSFARFAVTVF